MKTERNFDEKKRIAMEKSVSEKKESCVLIEDDFGMTYYYPRCVAPSLPFLCFPSETKPLGSRTSGERNKHKHDRGPEGGSFFLSKSSQDAISFHRRSGVLPSGREAAFVHYKMSSAKTLLKSLSERYEILFKKYTQQSEKDLWEKQAIFNSDLLYLIAATDGNEDSIGHSLLVARYALRLARACGINKKNFLVNIERGALLHDIGKIGIPESILRKADPLTALEKEIIKEHPLIGHEITEEFSFLKNASRVVLSHHEWYDGTGYPYGLAEEKIPLEARIFALADTLDAITSDRPYRKGQNIHVAYHEIEDGQGCQFDPAIVDAFFSVPESAWLNIKAETESALRHYTVH